MKLFFRFFLITILLIIIVKFAVQYFTDDHWENNSEKINTFSEPIQEGVSMSDIIKTVSGENFTIKPRASYIISARIVSKTNYNDSISKISPLDLALVWGNLADIKNKNIITYKQGGRWFSYNNPNNTFSPGYMSSHASNNHIIPVNQTLETAIKKLESGQLITLRGYLVDVISKDYIWNTSLTRTDDGIGACEIIYVESLKTTKSFDS